MKKRNKNIILIIVFVIILLILGGFYLRFIYIKKPILLGPSDHSVTRTFDKSMVLPGEDITVTLTVDTWDENDKVYTIEETIPIKLQIVNAGDGTVSGKKIKWAIYNSDGTPVTDRTHTYVVRSSELGTYAISGKYMFNSEKPPKSILGDSQINVVSCIPQPEICDGLDNDCDNIPDNGFEFDNCQGTCEYAGHTWVNNGGSLNCCGDDTNEDSPFQTSESNPLDLCSDNHDNDCDGLTDLLDPDCFACTPNTQTQNCIKQLGVCAGSQETCNPQGQWNGCDDSIYLSHNSKYEISELTCDNLDNDCDGTVDENPDNLCSHLGAYTCIIGNCECNSPFEEDSLIFNGNCNGCTSVQELSNYIYEWKVLDNLEITQEELTVSIHEYLTGVRLC